MLSQNIQIQISIWKMLTSLLWKEGKEFNFNPIKIPRSVLPKLFWVTDHKKPEIFSPDNETLLRSLANMDMFWTLKIFLADQFKFVNGPKMVNGLVFGKHWPIFFTMVNNLRRIADKVQRTGRH